MKTLQLLSFLLMTLILNTQAQEKYTYKFEAGVNLASFTVSDIEEGVSVTNKSLTSFHAGAVVNYKLNDKFQLQSGLTIGGKGGEQTYIYDEFQDDRQTTLDPHFAKSTFMSVQRPDLYASILPEHENNIVSQKTRVSLLYIELPLNLLYTIKTNSGNFHIGAGPYYAIGLSGKIKQEIVTRGEGTFHNNTDGKINFGNSDQDDIRRSDYGLNFLTGYQIKEHWSINAAYGLGLSNLVPDSESEGKFRNRVISVGIGYKY